LRIAIGGIAHETNTFNTMPTGLEAFEIQKEQDLLRDDAVKALTQDGIEVIPAIYAAAPPSGLIPKDVYLHLREELLRRVEAAGKLDGVCLFLHGAMEVEEIGSGETDLVDSIRQIVGDDALISASLDLHGNIAPELSKSADILTAYRTAPHIDVSETKVKAASLLVECIRNKLKPVSVTVKLPMLLPGEMAVTGIEPAFSLYRKLHGIDQFSYVLDSSLLVGMAWADTPNAGVSIIVVAKDKDYSDRAYEKACNLARKCWARRAEFHLDAPSGLIDDTIRIAKSHPKRPIFISDSGDNITGGAAGDIPLFVERLIASQAKEAVVAGILDPSAASLCKYKGVERRLRVEIGGKLDKMNGYPLEVEGRIINASSDGAMIRTDGIDVILTAHWQAFTTLDSFMSYDIDPLEHRIIVVKQGYLFPELRRVAAFHLMALSSGFTNLQLDQLDYRNVIRPIYPLDKDFSWKPAPEIIG